MNFRNWKCENCHSTEEPLRFGDTFECPCCGKTYTMEEMNSLLKGSNGPSFNESTFEDIEFFKDETNASKEEIKEQEPISNEDSDYGDIAESLDENYGDVATNSYSLENNEDSDVSVVDQECKTEYVNIYEKQPDKKLDKVETQVQEPQEPVKEKTKEEIYQDNCTKIICIIKSKLDGIPIKEKYKNIDVLHELTKMYNENFYQAAALLGICYETGAFVEKADIKKAIECYKVGCKHESALAYLNYANCLMKGNGVEKDPALAMEYYKKAANKKNSRAAIIYANACYYGKDVEQSYSKAFIYYKKAAGKNNPYAKYNLAQCYIKGRGVEKNIEEGLNILRELKNKNFEPAIKWLKDNNYQ